VQVVSERRKPRHDAATHDPEGEEGDRHGTPLPPDQAIGVSSNVTFSPSVRGSSGFDGLTYEPYLLRQSCETPWNSVCWQKRLTSIQLGRLPDTPSTCSARAAMPKGCAAAQPPGDVPGLTTNKMNSVNTSPST